MRQYYKGNVEILRVKNLTVNNSTPKVVQERVVVNKDVLFYKTRLGVIIRFQDKCPIPSYNEVVDYMSRHINGKSEPGVHESGIFLAEDSLVPVNISKEEEKKLIKQRRKQKKENKRTK